MIEQGRGKSVAITGAVLQLVFTAVMLTIWLWTGSLTAMSCAWMLAAGVLLWLMAAILFYCRELENREEIELAEIAARGGGDKTTIFDGQHARELRPAASRAVAMQKWVVPIFTILWSAAHAAIGILVIRYIYRLSAGPELASASAGALIAVVVSFAAFLFSRYCTGMGTQIQWRMLRATGSFMLVCSILAACTIVSLLAFTQEYRNLDKYLAFVAPAVQVLLAVELLLNFVLDLYRPRVTGKEARDSFDSRLLNLLAQPERVGHSIAETLNYQFGFEVSGTWFYRLVSKAMVPLIVLAVVVMIALSSVVIVHAGQESILLHYGHPSTETLKPGLHLKWPWPIDSIRTYNTGEVYQVVLGAGAEHDAKQRAAMFVMGKEMYLWTQEHGQRKELNFLVAVPPDQRGGLKDAEKTPPVTIVKLVVPLHYRISDPYRFDAHSSDTHSLVRAAAYREMVRYCASATLTEPLGPGEPDRPEAIMTYGRAKAAKELKRRVQKVVKDFGVEVTYLGMMAVHPPAEVAPEFEKVSVAERGRDKQRYRAQAQANQILSEMAGTPGEARSLALAIRARDELRSLQTGKGDELDRKRRDYVNRARSDLEAITKDVARQKLLGRVSAESLDYQTQLADYVKLLESTGKPGQVDLTKELASARARADRLFAQSRGKAIVKVVEAQAYRWARELKEMGDYESFGREELAYEACPEVYAMDRYLDVWDEVLPGIQKYILAVDRSRVELRLQLGQGVDAMQGAFTESMGN